MALETNPDVASLDLPDEDLATLREHVLQRDNQTCQRCLRMYRPSDLHIHRRIRIEGEISHPSVEPSAFVSLCIPCHGVQHADMEHFDGYRSNAPLYPEFKADPDVARVNVDHPNYTPTDEAIWLHHRLFDRDNYTCQRCQSKGVSPHGDMGGTRLTAYFPARPLPHGFACIRRMITVCQPCYRALTVEPGESPPDDAGQLLPDPDAHPSAALPRPPQSPEEEQTVRKFLREYCLDHDGNRCKRCLDSLPSSDDATAETVHLYTSDEDETYDPHDYVVVCSPCAAVLDPEDTEFEQEWLPEAQVHPHDDAHPDAAVERTRFTLEELQTLSSEKIRQVFETDSHQCQRCTSRELPESDLVAYPTFDVDDDIIDKPLPKYTTVCRPCASVMYHDGDHGTALEDLHSLEPLDPDAFAQDRESARPKATYPVIDKIVDVSRDPVNRKERLLSVSGLSRLHTAWKIGGTISIATVLYFLSILELLWLSRDIVSLPVTGWNSTPWIVVGGALAVISLGYGATVRWVIADLSSRFWNWIDPTIEPHHYRIDAANEWKRTLIAYGYMFLLPYLALVIGQIIFILILYLDWMLSPAIGV